MKAQIAALIAISFIGFSAMARPLTTGKKIVQDIQTLAEKCVVHPFSINKAGQKVYAPLKNTCSQIVVLDEKTAHVTVDNDTFEVILAESEDADGGDLNHVLVYAQDGHLVGQKLNVLAFDNLLLGLLGGRTGGAVEIEESSN